MRSTTNDLEISIRRGIFLGVSQVLHSLKDDDLLIKVTVSAIKKIGQPRTGKARHMT